MAVGDITSEFLSGSTNGRGIALSATATPGTLIHTAVSGTDFIDRITLYGSTVSTAVTKLTIEFGGTSTSDTIEIEGAAGPTALGFFEIVKDLPLRNGLVVRGFTDSASSINIFGFVLQEQKS